MLLFVDNFDSFSFNLIDYFKQSGETCLMVKNDTRWNSVNFEGVEGVVISPGPGVPNTSGNLLKLFDVIPPMIPVLGICLGHQAIGSYYGGKLRKAEKPMHGKISSVNLKAHYLFEGLPGQIEVVRYHSLVLEELPEVLEPIAEAQNGENMGITHKKLPYCGVQFHPEAFLTQYGLRIIKNWVNYNMNKK